MRETLVWGLAIYGALAGFVLCWMVLIVVRSAIVTLFVCFAEDPAVLYSNRKKDFDEIADVHPQFRQVHDTLASQQQ